VIYDERGEKVASVCGSAVFPNGTNFSLALSAFVPNPNGPGGTISIYLNGQLIATWNVTDTAGNLVPNGFYQFLLMETTGDGNTVQLERDAFISTYHGEQVSLLILPNVAHPGDILKFIASFAGIPADNQSKIKIYTTAGELVQTLGISAGTASWDLKNINSFTVVSGIYIAVLDGIDPAGGQKLSQVKKILVTH
jgi:hypothetical protein